MTLREESQVFFRLHPITSSIRFSPSWKMSKNASIGSFGVLLDHLQEACNLKCPVMLINDGYHSPLHPSLARPTPKRVLPKAPHETAASSPSAHPTIASTSRPLSSIRSVIRPGILTDE